MGLFDLFKPKNINQGIKEYQSVQGAVLLDVRTSQEYMEGHVPESKNVPLQTIETITALVKNGIYEGDKYWRNFLIFRKGGTIR